MSATTTDQTGVRELHRRQLAAARVAAVQRSRRRFRTLILALIAVGLTLPWVISRAYSEGARADGATPAETRVVENLIVRGRITVVNEAGREIAMLGQEESGPVVLALQDSAGEHQALRLATSSAGAVIHLRAPAGDAAVAMIATNSGPELELRHGASRRVISEKTPAPPVAQAQAPGSAPRAGRLPAVASAPDSLLATADVDLDISDVQPIGAGFMVANLSHEAVDGALRVTGRIINTTAVRHSDVRFRMGLGSVANTFVLTRVSPGNSTGFEIEIDGAAADRSRARIDYLGSVIDYASHRTRPHRGRVAIRP